MTSTAGQAEYDLVVAANRLPVDCATSGPAATPQWRAQAGSALTPLRSTAAVQGSAWIGWTGQADATEAALPLDDVWLHPISWSTRDADEHHNGYCVNTLAPVYHDHPEPVEIRPEWTDGYRTVNRRFAVAAARLAAPGAAVWVHDYHLQAVPRQLRQRRPDLRIGLLLHSPFPPAERFLRLPTRMEIMSGLLGADLLGFPDTRSMGNFLDLVGHLAHVTAPDGFVQLGDRRVAVGTFPTAIDLADIEWTATHPEVRARSLAIRTKLNDPETILLSVGPLDPAEGVPQRLDAYARLLAEQRLDPSRTVLIHVTTAGVGDCPRHRRLREQVDRQVAQINGLYARIGRPVVHYVHDEPDHWEMIALYLAADVMLATPLRGGATLTASEFLATRAGNTGRLVLSEFTGTAAELTRAIIVNPYDTDMLATAIHRAATEAGRRSADVWAMRERLRRRDAAHHAQQFLSALRERPAERQPLRAYNGAVVEPLP